MEARTLTRTELEAPAAEGLRGSGRFLPAALRSVPARLPGSLSVSWSSLQGRVHPPAFFSSFYSKITIQICVCLSFNYFFLPDFQTAPPKLSAHPSHSTWTSLPHPSNPCESHPSHVVNCVSFLRFPLSIRYPLNKSALLRVTLTQQPGQEDVVERLDTM